MEVVRPDRLLGTGAHAKLPRDRGRTTRLVNSTTNLNPVPTWVNQIKANYYSSTQPFSNGMTVRNWLNGQSFAQQLSFGLDVTEQITSKLIR